MSGRGIPVGKVGVFILRAETIFALRVFAICPHGQWPVSCC